MARARNKDDLLKFATENYSKLMDIISKMTENQMNTLFDFSGDKSKKEAHWNRDKNVRDVLIHLYEWHQLMLKFIENNADGKSNDDQTRIMTPAEAIKQGVDFLVVGRPITKAEDPVKSARLILEEISEAL